LGIIGYGITQSDLVKDIIADYKDDLKFSKNLQITTQNIIKKYKPSLGDEELPLLNLALAKCEWQYGCLAEERFNKVQIDYQEKNGFTIWEEAGEKALEKRIKVLENFIDMISTPNPKPSKFPKLIARPPMFSEGDCLLIDLENGNYGLALVVKSDHSNIEYGLNLIIKLNYCKSIIPTENKLKRIKPYKLTKDEVAKIKMPGVSYYKKQVFLDYKYRMGWFMPLGYKNMAKKFQVIGNIDVTKYKKFKCNRYSSWDVLQQWFD